jgi:hypothetical protein
MSLLRTWHAYLGILIAPSVLFFAITGAVQLFSLHEAHGKYHPAPMLEKLSSLHKDQVFALKSPAEKQTGAEEPEDDKGLPFATAVLKWFFLAVAMGLCVSTSIGLWIGLTHVRHRRVGWWLLAFGILLPTCLTLM